ncbi:oligopeptide transport system substrate-binding protein [Caminicella sporogenes DSM 14501]|uniref:Oligopeptide transport system substrate-binding protein n=1 Tax=Caminicella sporogenes DSM 14501 TaxID=1121266 RepID=A0A1M6Q8C8_9FIRM|nr:peptide ABC transporter substrate-binding protein [Caminicella sporogenes]RKD23613.1 peptide ABC transporter substrate-binding protein [Caminicella sporogenes]WIF93956.1 peptide ABC transporter substrate-binding protein [Caminicella sporogenes]SHK16408.1 oligopeptide transport system substrate-binding protein [Caminicella sporogenes DSM 14501]
MFKRKFVLTLTVLLILTTVLSGCGSSKTTQQPQEKNETSNNEPVVLNFNLAADPRTIDPGLNDAIDGSHVINNTFEGLMREIDGKLENAMAEKVDISDDGTVYTFHIRDAKWSDGKPVRAQDFEYAWKRVLDPSTAAPYSYHMFYIKNAKAYYEGKAKIEDVGIKAIDDKTFKVTLETPTSYFLSLITRPAFMPVRKDIVEKAPETWAKDPNLAVSNGPFILADYKTADKLVLKKNPNYWAADTVKIDQINYLMIIEASTALTAYESGEIDIIGNIPSQEIPRLMGEDSTFHVLPMLGTYYLIFNVNRPPTDDVKVRRALALAIDRKAITENVKRSGEIPATGFNPAGLKDSQGRDFNKTAGDYGINVDGGNIEEAKKLLAKAGYPDGKGFPEITLLYNTSESHKAIAEAIQEMWKKNLGINIRLANQEWAVFQDTRKQGNFDIARGGYISDYPDPVGLLELFTTNSANNAPHWSNKEYDELIAKSRLVKGTERDELLYKAQDILMKEMPVTPIFYYTDPVMVKDYVKGWQKNSMSYWYFGRVSIEK